MGQGIAVTRLQMMMAMCAIANNGTLMRPMLINRLEDAERQCRGRAIHHRSCDERPMKARRN